MRLHLISKIVLFSGVVGALALASLSPAPAAQTKKMTGACAQPNGRCVSDCNQSNWCTVYTCTNGQSTPVPFWQCYEPSGLCLAPRC